MRAIDSQRPIKATLWRTSTGTASSAQGTDQAASEGSCRHPIETLLRGQGPEFTQFIDTLQVRHGGGARKAVRQLHQIWLDYPADGVAHAISTALEYGLTNLSRIERMILRRIAGDFFQLPLDSEEDDDG